MATQVQYRRGTASENNAYTGALAEITVDTTNGTLRVHNGITAGGSNIATVSYVSAQLAALSANSITDGTSNVKVYTNGNVATTVGGVANVFLVSSTGATVTGDLTVTGNATLTGNILGDRIQNGTTQIDIQTQNGNANITVGGTSNVAVFATTGLYITGTNNTTGNVTGGNLTTSGQVVATGNVTGGNLNTAGQVVATGNITGGNLSGASVVGTLLTASQPNITTVGTLGSLSVTGNVTSGNLNISGDIYDTGPLSLITAASGNINLAPNGTNVITATTTGANITGTVTATGNITGGNLSAGSGSIVVGQLIMSGNTIQSTQANLVIDPSGGGATTGTLFIAGNLDVQGAITVIESTTLTTNELVLQIANTAATASAANGAGISVGPFGSGYASFTYNSVGNVWTVSNGANVSGALNATGNITGGNLTTTGTTSTDSLTASTTITATGNITGGNISATNHTGTTVSVTGNISGGNLSVGTGTVTAGNIVNSNANGVGNIGSSTTYFNTVFAKATSAQYADLAEMYVADANYEPGTVVEFGGAFEVTISTVSHSTAVAGIVSTNPSYLMNSTQQGNHVVPVALTGRVPCRVQGPVKKGDVLVSSSTPGVAQRIGMNWQPGCVLGKSMEVIDTAEIRTIEVAVGRL